MASECSERQQAWARDGLFVVPRVLSSTRVSELAEACDHVLRKVRAASAGTGHTTTHITGLLAPDYFVDRPDVLERLAGFASSREVIALVHDLGMPDEGRLNLRTTHYFHEPSARDYDGEWHRDDDLPSIPGDSAVPAPRPTRLRFRVAFCRDDHLEYVPGSHRREDTPEELQLRRGHVRNAPLSTGTVRIRLEPGDVCVFDTWGIHRGRYRHGTTRRSLDLLFRFGIRESTFGSETVRKYIMAARKLG